MKIKVICDKYGAGKNSIIYTSILLVKKLRL